MTESPCGVIEWVDVALISKRASRGVILGVAGSRYTSGPYTPVDPGYPRREQSRDKRGGGELWGEISVKITQGCSRSIRVYGIFIWVWCVFIWVWSFHSGMVF